MQALSLAQCDEILAKFPERERTLIGAKGVHLSGGKVQRIAIARAILKNALFLLLDEISESLDVGNEMAIQEALNALTVDKTVIIVSRRLKSIEQVNQIVVMDAGRVDAVGTHAHLLADSALYRRLIKKSRMTNTFQYQ